MAYLLTGHRDQVCDVTQGPRVGLGLCQPCVGQQEQEAVWQHGGEHGLPLARRAGQQQVSWDRFTLLCKVVLRLGRAYVTAGLARLEIREKLVSSFMSHIRFLNIKTAERRAQAVSADQGRPQLQRG